MADMDGKTYFGAVCKWNTSGSHITKHCVSGCSLYPRRESYCAGASQHQLYPEVPDNYLNY